MTDESRARAWREKNGSLYIVNSNQRTWHDSDAASYARSEVIRELEQLAQPQREAGKILGGVGGNVNEVMADWLDHRITELRAQEEKS